MARTTELRPKVGTVTEDKYDAQHLCRRKTWVSNVRETDAVLVITYTTSLFYRKGTVHHNFYGDKSDQPDGTRKCEFCGCSEPLKAGKEWYEKCPVEQRHVLKSTQTSQKYLVVAGPHAGKRLTEADAGDGYVSYNRSSRWGKSDEIPKVVLIPVAALKGKK